MTILANLVALLSLENSAYLQGLEASQGATDGFTGSLSTVGGAVVVGGLTAAASAVATVGVAAWEAGNAVDGAMDTISVATGATGNDLDGLRKDFEGVFTRVPTDVDSAASAISVLNSRLDISGQALQDTSVGLLEMSRITGGDLTANGEAFTRMVGDWNLNLQDLPGYMDQVFTASQQTGAEVGTLMEQIVQYGAPMRNFGFSFQESGALLAGFAAQGVNTEIVMSGLRTAQGKFIAQGKDMSSGLWETIDAIQNAETQTEALGIATNIFGAKAAGDWLDTIRGGKFDLEEITNAMMDSRGAIMEGAAATLGWSERWGMFKNRVTTGLAPLGKAMEDAAVDGLSQITTIFERPEAQQGIATFATMAVQGITRVVTYLPVLIGGLLTFVTFLQQNEGIVVGVLAALGVAALAWGATTAVAAWTAMAPMLPVIAVLGLIALGAYLLYEAWQSNFGGIQDKAGAAWAYLQPIFSQLTDWLKVNIPAGIATLSQFWTGTLLPAITAVWAWIDTNLVPLFRALIDVWLAGLSLQITALAGFWQNVLLPAVQAFSSWMGDNVLPVIQQVAEWLGEKLGPAFDGLGKGIQDVTGWLSGLANKLNSLKLPDWLTPGSPTPWEIGLWGVSDAMSDLTRKQLPTFGAELRLQSEPVGLAPTQAGVASAASAQGPVIVNLQYAPFVSTANEREARAVLGPVLEDYLRNRENR